MKKTRLPFIASQPNLTASFFENLLFAIPLPPFHRPSDAAIDLLPAQHPFGTFFTISRAASARHT
jgi:hypothetical protein